MSKSALPIGVFDSGVGGLTVLNSISRVLSNENLIYLGDTARVPYGTKSEESVIKYAIQAAGHLIEKRIKILVVACNTASSVALEALREKYSGIPIIGVVEPGAMASCERSKTGSIGVIGTEGTISGGAYQREISKINPNANVIGKACSLFVALAEEGLVEGEIVDGVIEHYLSKDILSQIDCLVLGCTHFPVLAKSIKNLIGDSIALVDSADTTAEEVSHMLKSDLSLVNSSNTPRSIKFLVTDGPQRFARVAKIFFDHEVLEKDIQLVDI